MFLEAQEMMGQGFPSSSADVQSWVVQEDGLFRAAFGAHVTEPWNRERLYLQLERSVLAKPGPTLDERAQELRSDEDREMLGSGLCAPRLAPLEDRQKVGPALPIASEVEKAASGGQSSLRAAPGRKPNLAVPSSTGIQRPGHRLRKLCLRVEISALKLRPCDSVKARRASSLDALDSRETRVAGELQELFHRYQKEMESHIVAQLDSRLDMLVERGKALRTALFEAEGLPSDAQATQAAQAVLAAREAYRSNLQERRKVRARHADQRNAFRASLQESLRQMAGTATSATGWAVSPSLNGNSD
ncbi:CC2D2A [Symbiodinium sp. CCMP2592]|nr:CC2D2A [Symbiodinium sp. CCMP2592]